MLHVHAADEIVKEDLQVNQDFNHCFTSGIFIRSLLQIKISVCFSEKCFFFVYNLSVLEITEWESWTQQSATWHAA